MNKFSLFSMCQSYINFDLISIDYLIVSSNDLYHVLIPAVYTDVYTHCIFCSIHNCIFYLSPLFLCV